MREENGSKQLASDKEDITEICQKPVLPGWWKTGCMILIPVIVASALVMAFLFIGTYRNALLPKVAAQLAKDTEAILVKRGVCSLDECNRQEWVKMSEAPDQATVYIYLADRLDKETVAEVASQCLKIFEEKERKVEIRLKLYKETMQQTNRELMRDTPIMSLTFKGGK